MVLAGGLMACLGIAQFMTGHTLVDSITLPGFTISQDVGSVQARGDFTRAAGTATHPLEYGALLCMVLPLAIAMAITDRKYPVWRRSWPAVAIIFAVILSVSRSALIGVFVGLLLFAPSMPPKIRRFSIPAGVVALTAMTFVVPGLIGTIRGLFISISSDSSTLSRTNSIGDALQIAFRNPIFGQGFGTFLPSELILDNQFLLILIEGGLTGIIALLAVGLTSIVSAWRASRMTKRPEAKMFYTAAAAGTAAGLVLLAFFDGLSFPITAGALFVMVSICGIMLEIEVTERRENRLARLDPGSKG
jgi:O-antigen ligase